MKRILKRDFDLAVKQPWNGRRCIGAQAMIREGGVITLSVEPYNAARHNPKALAVVMTFDNNFEKPGDEKKPELQALRASLPITL